jgi:CRP/FNR family transcriptional regulator
MQTSTLTPPRPVRHALAAHVAETLALVQQHVAITRRIVHAGERLFAAGDALEHLYVIHSGLFKTVDLSADGRERIAGLHFRGDWLGFDGMAEGRYGCEAVAMDTGEIWSIRHATLLAACARAPALMSAVHAAMSREIAQSRDAMMALTTLPADARVAEFLRRWAEALESRGLRGDHITLRLTRAEIGDYLGMKLETVSRALSRLARSDVIDFAGRGRREVRIPDVHALEAFVENSVAAPVTLQ